MKNVWKKILVVMMAVVVMAGYLPLDTVDAATMKLNKSKVTVFVGKTVNLKMQGTSKKVTWTSNNKSIATVSKGKITGKKAGTATVTAKVAGQKFTCKVTVKKPYLNKKKATVYVGKTVKLKLNGAKVKSFTSKNKAVATVNQYGKVTAKKKGTAKIVVKDTKGRLYYCTVTVKKPASGQTNTGTPVTPPVNPSLNKTDIYIGAGYTFPIKLTGARALSWTSSNEKVATVDAYGEIRGCYAGTATITCHADNGRDYTAKVTVSCYNHVQSPTTETIKEPTCMETGILRTYCKNCDYYYDRMLSTVDHEHFLSYTVPATCENYGKAYYICKWCYGREYSTPYGSPSGHAYSYNGTVTASKAGPGYEAYVCGNCNEVEQRNKVDYNPSEAQVYNDMIAMKSQYYEGMPWDNSNYYGWNAGYYSGGYGCAGFAFMLSDAAFGYLPANIHGDFDNIKPGDILRVNNDSHSVVVLKIEGDKYTLAEGNYNYSIHWFRTMTLSDIKANADYVMTRYPQ